jgi:4-amino-4-deoxy-L-arabinose transferase-like glycosyltransferase
MHSESKNLFPIIALWCLLLLPWLFGKGIFADGLYYGTIASNWAFGAGATWKFYVSESLMNPFYSHPPLAFWIEGVLFKFFGNYHWVDRVLGLICFVLTVIAMLRIWRLYFPSGLSWLPLFVLMLLPTAAWAYSNNVLENSMSMFCIWAVYLQLSAAENRRFSLLKNIISGLLIFAATLCKGPTALFPLALPFLLILFRNNRSRTQIIISFLSLPIFLSAVLLLLMSDEAFAYLKAYYEIQIQGSFSIGGKNGSPLLLKQLLMELLPLLSVAALILFWSGKKIVPNKASILLLLIAVSASFPILFSPKQMGFYLLPSLPYWALGIAGSLQKIEFLKKNITTRIKLYFSLFVFVTAVSLMTYNINRPIRDVVLIEDISKICTYLPSACKAGLEPELNEHWKLQGYFAREKQISFYPIGHAKYKYNVGRLSYKIDNCETIYKGKELQLCRCPMPE